MKQWGPLPSRLAFFQREVVNQLFVLFLLDKSAGILTGYRKITFSSNPPSMGTIICTCEQKWQNVCFEEGVEISSDSWPYYIQGEEGAAKLWS